MLKNESAKVVPNGNVREALTWYSILLHAAQGLPMPRGKYRIPCGQTWVTTEMTTAILRCVIK